MEMLCVLIVVMIILSYNFVKTDQTKQLKMVNFTDCKWYLNKPTFKKKDNIGEIFFSKNTLPRWSTLDTAEERIN